ncbi:LysR substrate-binding domain-containing protein [Alphaproteobacteria bacterium]|jgi:DNA-binding transcriptional LysR family regulator|nr:LysR substrate-binding domain-containing protein [Alphaproteobacteria bacterium]
MDQLRAISYFIKVAELGSFAEASKALGVPASSVSRRLQDLEAALGVTLLSRTTRVVKLTELGQIYLDRVRPTINDLRHANELVRNQLSAPKGSLRISAITGYGEYMVVPALRRLRQLYPDLIVDLELTDQLIDLANDDVDIAIRVTAAPPERAIARQLNGNRSVLVASPDYLSQHGIPETLDDLQHHQTLLYRGPDRIVYWQAKTAGGWTEIKTQPAFVCNIGKELRAEAAAGHGLALLPSWGVQPQIDAGHLQAVTLNDGKLHLSRNEQTGTYLLYQQPKYRLTKIKVAVDFLVETLTDPAELTP